MTEPIVLELSQLVLGLHIVLSIVVTVHVLLTNENSRAAVAWVGLVWLSPLLGSILYWIFGINRIRRRALKLRLPVHESRSLAKAQRRERATWPIAWGEQLFSLSRVGHELTGLSLEEGNAIECFERAELAYRSMIAAIDSAQKSVSLCSYIFSYDEAGRPFVDALGRAVARGVNVRVLIDDVGLKYSYPTVMRPFRKAGVTVARFLPTLLPWEFSYMNLRNHRKILVVDGTSAFTGGLNIRRGYLGDGEVAPTIDDLHFRFNGPVVRQMQQSFAEDWYFITGEKLQDMKWFPTEIPRAGTAHCRAVGDGPDNNTDILDQMLFAAVTKARSRVDIVSPYFLPTEDLITALCNAAYSGVRVRVLLPRVNNLRFVRWASLALLPKLLRAGCEIFEGSLPFDHSKLMLVDEAWVFCGSANWDPRSLKLNFELNVECYDTQFCEQMNRVFERKIARAARLHADELRKQSLLRKLRNKIAFLFHPYL